MLCIKAVAFVSASNLERPFICVLWLKICFLLQEGNYHCFKMKFSLNVHTSLLMFGKF